MIEISGAQQVVACNAKVHFSLSEDKPGTYRSIQKVISRGGCFKKRRLVLSKYIIEANGAKDILNFRRYAAHVFHTSTCFSGRNIRQVMAVCLLTHNQ